LYKILPVATEIVSSVELSDTVDIGDVGGVSSEESENERCNLKSLGNGPKKTRDFYYHIILNLWVTDLRTRRDLY
jgi:hypothetical protein